jgi:Flp pilus assembly protein TadG
MNNKIHETRVENGQSMVEFAFGMVILVIILVGIVDLGRAFFIFMALRDAAQEGAVYGSICPEDVAKIEERVRSISSEPVDFTDTGQVEVACAFITFGGETPCNGTVPTAGNGIRVSVTYHNFVITMPFLGAFIGSQTIDISAHVMDTILRTTCPQGVG